VEKITKEGKRAITELHNHLAKWKGDPGEGNDIGLEHAEALALAAEDHATDIGKTGAASHNGTDRSNFAQRQRRYIKPARISTELIWYGQLDFEKYETLVALVEQGKRIVDDLLIDDGVKDRGHRKALLDCRYQKIGLHIADHLVFGQCLVMECCDDIVETHDLNERKEKGPVKQDLEEQEKIRKQAETTWKVISICARCKKPIKGGRVVEAKFLRFHENCFVCFKCNCKLRGKKFHLHDDRRNVVCEPCSAKKAKKSHRTNTKTKGGKVQKKKKVVTAGTSFQAAKTTIAALGMEYANLG